MDEKTIREYREYLNERKALLDTTIKQLKNEFVGINHVIDQVADAMSGWFFFPEMQDRPVIINLWGLTGIGKTSLVKRLTQLLELEERYYRFDLGESSSGEYNIQDTFRDIYDNSNGHPFIIGLDEFQLARTINEDREEVDKASSRAMWDLLDSGKFDLIDFNSYQMNNLNKLIKKLDRALINQVVVENGAVVENKEAYDKIFAEKSNNDYNDDDSSDLDDDAKTMFVSDNHLNTLYYIDDKSFLSQSDIREELDRLDGEETMEFLIKIYKKALKPVTVDCTKSLIFVMGNLDEVYSMSQNFNPDISADEFHRQSLEITITQVKNSLLSRFRSEQIARLGNNHIIYPSFNTAAFNKIIDQELVKIKKKVGDIYHVNIEFEESLKELIYSEGVYPTQGTRPLFTTIHQVVSAKLGQLLREVFISGYWNDKMVFRAGREVGDDHIVEICVDFYREGKKIYTFVQDQKLVLGKLRKEKKDDQQAITAVHESGHAVLSSILMHTIPTSVFSVTADNQSLGFVLARPEWNYVSKGEVINRLAVLFGGIEAERLIFGDDKITLGASQDLANATRLATYVIYSCGFGEKLAAYGNTHMDEVPTIIFDSGEKSLNNHAEDMLNEAQELAAKTLKEQKNLLLQMANYLSDKRMLDKDAIKEYVKKYAANFDVKTLIDDADNLFYREHLKSQIGDGEN